MNNIILLTLVDIIIGIICDYDLVINDQLTNQYIKINK